VTDKPLRIDPMRYHPDRGTDNGPASTGVFVRAQHPAGSQRWESVDIADLDADSLHQWLRSRGGENSWAESVVAIMLGHDHTVAPWAMPPAVSP
jgi:hypothetical protein